MPVTLTATPLPDYAAVRLQVFASTDNQVVVSEDYSAGGAFNAALKWTSSGNAVVTAPGNYGLELVPATGTDFNGSGYVERSLTGLVVGRTYQVNLPMDIAGDARQIVMTINTSTPTTRTTSASEIRATDDYYTATPTTNTVVWLVFVATATSHTVRLTPSTTTQGASFGVPRFLISSMDVRWVGANTKRLELGLSGDAANWTNGGTNPTNGSRSISASSLSYWAADPSPTVWARYAANTSTTATYPGDSQWLLRTVTGLTVGRSYRVHLVAEANQLTASFTKTRLRTRVGVVGKGETSASTSLWKSYDFTATATSHQFYVKVADSMTATGSTAPVADVDIYYVRVIDRYAELTNFTLNSLTRSDVNGTADVRLQAGQVLSGGSLIVTDYEPALSGAVTYTAVVGTSTPGVNETTTASVSSVGFTGTVLAPATLPQYRQVVTLMTDNYGAARESTHTVHNVVDRADPVVTLGVLRTREDSAEFLADSLEAARALQDVYQRGEVVLLRTTDLRGLDMYHVVTRASVVPSGRRWLVQVDYVEVTRPDGPLLGALGWTFDAANAYSGTFNDARNRFASFNDYTVGPNG